MAPADDIEVGILSFISFFRRFSRKSLALRDSALRRRLSFARERLLADGDLPSLSFREFVDGEASGPELEGASSSLLLLSSSSSASLLVALT